MPKISVIVPVYKVEKFLKHCVDSILVQTFGSFELILVDDGSPDNCPAMCDEYARLDERVHVIHQENGGLSAARNTGIDWVFANSDSEWLTFIDSDDWVHEKYLELLYNAVVKTNNKVAVCDFIRVKERTANWPTITGETKVMEVERFFCDTEGHSISVCKIYQRSLFQKIRFPVGRLHEDEFTTYKLMFGAATITYMPERLYAYYANPNGITGGGWSVKRMDSFDAIEEQIIFFKEKKYFEAMRSVIRRTLVTIRNTLKDFNSTELMRKSYKIQEKRFREYANMLCIDEPKDAWVLMQIRPIRTKIRIYWRALKQKFKDNKRNLD